MRDIALFVDHDNAQLAAEEREFNHCWSSSVWMGLLVREVERVCEGNVVIRRAYGDVLLNAAHVFAAREWKPQAIRNSIEQDMRMQRDLADHGFQMIHCPTITRTSGNERKKNRADIFLSLDCLEIATKYTNIEVIAVLSHDSDVSALCQRLRGLGRSVALVTLDEMPPRILRSLATHIVQYDQAAIDRYGYDVLADVVDDLLADAQDPLATGAELAAVKAQIMSKDPQFSHEALGFRRLTEFVEACVEDEVVQDRGVLRLRSPRVLSPASIPTNATQAAVRAASRAEAFAEPAANTGTTVADKAAANVRAALQRTTPRVVGGPAPTALDAEAAPSGSRQEILLAALRKADVRPLPEVRRAVGQRIRETYLPDSQEPGPALSYSQLAKKIETEFATTHSKSKIRDVLRILSMSGAIELERGTSLAESRVIRYLPAPEARQCVLRLFLKRLAAVGVTVVPADDADLCNVAFGEVDPDLLRYTRAAIEESRVSSDVSAENSPAGPQ